MISRTVFALITMLLLCSQKVHAQTQEPAAPVEGLFQEWLTAFNSGDAVSIKAFYGQYRGDPDAAFPIDLAEETCGFDTVRIEEKTPLSMRVLLAERCYPGLARLTIQYTASAEVKPEVFDLEFFALSDNALTQALSSFADRLEQRDKFAGSLLLAQGDEIVWGGNWGTLNKGSETQITVDTPMFLASAGKMFTAVAVLQLVEQGKAELDAPLGEYLTDYPNIDMAKVTLRQLLQHRGGAGDIGILARGDAANRTRIKTIDDAIAFNGNRPPAFAPGSKTDYSNYGFLLLGAVVESISGTDYYDYIDKHIFAPAGMTNAGFPDLDNLENIATGYTTFYGEEETLVANVDALPWRGSPAGGGVASANDMLQFFRALQANILLSPEMTKLAITAGETPWYGLGFVVNSAPNASWGHGGNSYGMDVATHHYPAKDTTFICLATRDFACNRMIFHWYNRVFGVTE